MAPLSWVWDNDEIKCPENNLHIGISIYADDDTNCEETASTKYSENVNENECTSTYTAIQQNSIKMNARCQGDQLVMEEYHVSTDVNEDCSTMATSYTLS